jgi:DNA-binding phage protein
MSSAPDRRTGVVRDIGLVIERVGWREVARRTGVDRCALHRTFSRNGRGHPTLATLDRVLPHVGLRLTIVEAEQ